MIRITDNWGNEFHGATFDIRVSADKTPPAVTELKVATEETLKIKFDKNVSFSKNNVEVLNADGSINSSINITVTGSDMEYTINLGTNMRGKSILVKIKNVEDKSLIPNKLVLYTAVLDVIDMEKPYVTKITKKIIPGGEQSIYVFFNEKVSGTALVKDNYFINDAGTMKKVTNTPEFYYENKVVKIPLSNEEKDVLGLGTTSIVIMNIQDLYGNIMDGQTIWQSAIMHYNDPTNVPKVEKAEVTEKNKVVITFDQHLVLVDPAAFIINSEVPIEIAVSNNDDGNTVVTLTTDDTAKFTCDLSGTASVIIAPSSTIKLENIFGVNAANVTLTTTSIPALIDKVKPVVMDYGILTMDFNIDGKIDHIAVYFEESIKHQYVSVSNFEIVGYTVLDAYVLAGGTPLYDGRGSAVVGDSHMTFVRVKQKDTIDSGATPGVKIKGVLKDLHDNEYEISNDIITSFDGVMPAISAVTLSADNKVVTVEFSEPVINTRDIPTLKTLTRFAADGISFNALDAADSVEFSGGKFIITFNTALSGTSNKIEIGSGVFMDIAGNSNLIIITPAIEANPAP